MYNAEIGFFVPLPLLHMLNFDWLKENINSPIMCAAFIQQLIQDSVKTKLSVTHQYKTIITILQT